MSFKIYKAINKNEAAEIDEVCADSSSYFMT